MNEEIEYAEMLEIPVSTVNVVKKKRRVHGKNANNLKERLISRINDRVGADEADRVQPDSFAQDPVYASAENAAIEDAAANTGREDPELNEFAYREGGERLDTVLLSDGPAKGRRKSFFAGAETDAEEENRTPASRRAGILLTAEFAVACLLCGGIFLTNVFMPSSAINTFFRSLMPGETATADNRVYSDLELGSVVSELSDAELSISPAGVLSFTDECCVYPVADGKVAEVTENADGTYNVRVDYTDSFYGMLSGLDYVYYEAGDKVYGNVPVGYSNGESAVQVTMYSDDVLLNCYTVDSENCLSWVTSES